MPAWTARLRLALLGMLLIGLPCGDSWGRESQTKSMDRPVRVLILFAESPTYLAYPIFTKSFQETLAGRWHGPVDYAFEYLAMGNASSDRQYLEDLRLSLAAKYRGIQPDAVVLVGGTGAPFVLAHGADLFPGRPIILYGASMGGAQAPIPFECTVLATRYDPVLAVRGIKQVLPSARRVAVVLGDSPGERRLAEDWKAALGNLDAGCDVEFVPNESVDQTLGHLLGLRGDCAILFHSYFRDGRGNSHYPVAVLDMLVREGSVPVFAAQDTFLGLGAVGGYLISNRQAGETVARIVSDVLAGVPHGGVESVDVTGYAYDWRQLRSWNIPESRLPAGSRVEFRGLSVWDAYRTQIVTVLAVIVFLCACVVWLLLNRTRRLRAEARLKESEAYLQTIFDSVSDCIFVHTWPDGSIVDVNHRACTLYGYDREEFLRLSVEDISAGTPFDQARAMALMAKAHEGQTQVAEWQAKSKEGGQFWVEVSIRRASIRGVRHILVSSRSITGRKMAEEALRKSLRALRAFKEFSNAMLQAADESSLITNLCRLLVEVCGYRMAWVGMAEDGENRIVRPVGHWGGENVFAGGLRITWDDSPEGNGAVGRAIKTRRVQVGQSISTDARFAPWRDLIGRERYESCLALPLCHEDQCLGTLTIYGVESDVFDPAETELLSQLAGDLTYGILSLRQRDAHRRAEVQLRQSEEKFSRLFRLSPDAIVLQDLETMAIVEVNHAFMEITGFSQEEVLGKSLWDLGVYLDGRERNSAIDRLTGQGHADSFEMDIIRKDAGTIQVSVACQVIGLGDKGYLLAIARDMTEFKKMQEVMIQSEKMISLGNIAAGIAHEINNPLGIISQCAQNIRMRILPDSRKNREVAAGVGLDLEAMGRYVETRKLGVFLQDIHDASQRASTIIRNMLNFSRRSESRRSVCDVMEIIRQALFLAENDYDLKKSYDFRQININIDNNGDLPPLIGTQTELEQVFLNLLRNAAQALATADPPPLDPCIRIYLSTVPGHVRVEIADNGPGILPEIRHRLFEPFFTTKPPGLGTGLGLSVSYFIVTKGHGGRMTVFSEPGVGTTFRIDLPVGDGPNV